MSLDLLSLGYEILGYFLVVTIPSLRGIKCHSLATKTFQKHFTLRKMVFSSASMTFFSLGFKLLRFFRFWECWCVRDQRSQFENKTKDIFFNKSFRYISSFCKKVFSTTSVFNYKILRFFCFSQCQFREIKGQSLKTKDFSKVFFI